MLLAPPLQEDHQVEMVIPQWPVPLPLLPGLILKILVNLAAAPTADVAPTAVVPTRTSAKRGVFTASAVA
jgi:hypothetical protein